MEMVSVKRGGSICDINIVRDMCVYCGHLFSVYVSHFYICPSAHCLRAGMYAYMFGERILLRTAGMTKGSDDTVPHVPCDAARGEV